MLRAGQGAQCHGACKPAPLQLSPNCAAVVQRPPVHTRNALASCLCSRPDIHSSSQPHLWLESCSASRFASAMRFLSSWALPSRSRRWSLLIRGQCRGKLPCMIDKWVDSVGARDSKSTVLTSNPTPCRATPTPTTAPPHLPVPLECAELADVHAARPALLCGGAAAHLARHHQLRGRRDGKQVMQGLG